MLQWMVRFVALAILALAALPAQARVTITFWSYENGGDFPHAFFTVHGTPERGGSPARYTYGFTPKTVTPMMLIGNTPGKVSNTPKSYLERGTPHFATQISDAQYDAVMSLAREWGDKGNNTYSLNRRNCVHFVAEAMRRSGLQVVEAKNLMKKPRSFTESIQKMNDGRIRAIGQAGTAYVAATPALANVGR